MNLRGLHGSRDMARFPYPNRAFSGCANTSPTRRNITAREPFRKNTYRSWKGTMSHTTNGMCGIESPLQGSSIVVWHGSRGGAPGWVESPRWGSSASVSILLRRIPGRSHTQRSTAQPRPTPPTGSFLAGGREGVRNSAISRPPPRTFSNGSSFSPLPSKLSN